MFGRQSRQELDRSVAFDARPMHVPVKSAEADAKGELHVVMEYARPNWQQRIGGSAKCERTFVLDRLGREVYEWCDEKRSVRQIVARFAAEHKVSCAEAEYSVTTYLKTLLKKGLVAMVVDRHAVEARARTD